MTEGEPTRSRLRRAVVWPSLGAVVVIAVLFVGVFPTRTFLAQRSAVARAEEQLRVLTAENERLDDRVDALNTPDEIERLAREQFELVRPGEQPYVVLPPAEAQVSLPTGWPFGGLVISRSPGT
ncbi:MAG: FtsB family cell division protein [Acidimicrobiales bacterium]